MLNIIVVDKHFLSRQGRRDPHWGESRKMLALSHGVIHDRITREMTTVWLYSDKLDTISNGIYR